MIKCVFTVLGMLVLSSLVVAAPPPREAALRAFINAPQNNVVTIQRANGKVGFLGADPQRPIPETSLRRRPEDRAHAFLNSSRNLFVDAATPLSLITTRVQESDHIGISHVRVQQTLQGIPVRGADAVVRLNTAGITAVSSKLISAVPELSTMPTISSDAALRTAQMFVQKKYGPVPADFSVPQLEILDVGLFHGQPGQPQLSWFITAGGDALYERIWINAISGALAYNYSQLTNARNRRTFDANNASIVAATPTRSETQGPSGITDVDNGFDFIGDFWNYYFTVHGRDSYDGAGATLNSIMRYCNPRITECPMKGAFWDGKLSVQRIFLGSGYATDDVIAHELTHAVIDYTSNLVYSGESGALNESYADIFGETIDLWNGKGDDKPSVRWMIGEELPGYVGTGLRNLLDPALRGQPGKVTDASYQCDAADNFGVHQNSGVPNHAYALMVDGGSYNGYSIEGIGLDKAAKIQYRTLLFLPTASRLADNFDGLNQACNELIGTDGITHDDCAQVKTAALAVEMTTPPCEGAKAPAPPAATPAPVPAVARQCPVGQVMQVVFADDFENTTTQNWVTYAGSGANHWLGGSGNPGIYYSTHPASGGYALYGKGGVSIADSSVMMKSDVTLPANALMQFAGSYDFESGFDGGVIEYSIDAGSTWLDAGAFIKLGRNYDGVLFNGIGNPLSGRAAFTGHTGGTYVDSQLDLSSLAGRAVRFRLRMGTDDLVASPGWQIDNLSIFSCAITTGGLTITPTQGLRTSEAGGSTSFTMVLATAPSANVTLTLASSRVGEGRVSPSVVTFNNLNWNVPVTVTVTGVDDVADDGDMAYSIITTGVTSADPSYNNLMVPNVDVINADNDTAGLLINPSTGLETTEAGGTAMFTVALTSQPTADVTLSFASSNSREAKVLSTTETFTAANWSQGRSIMLKGIDDSLTDGNVSYMVTADISDSLDPNYAGLGTFSLTATNLDNDPASLVVSPAAGLTTSEAGGKAMFLVRLSSQPRADVTLNLASSNPAEGTLAPSSLTFQNTNWDIPQMVVVTGIDDALSDGNLQYTVVLNPAVSADPNYNALDAPDITLVNIDNDRPSILIAPGSNLYTTESGGSSTFTITLSKAPTANVTIAISSGSPGEATVNPATIIFTSNNWDQPAAVVVTGIDDNVLDGDISYSIITAPASSNDVAYNAMNAPDIFLVNRDNDRAAIMIDPMNVLSTSESGGSATFSVVLARQPNAAVSLSLTSSNPAEGMLSSMQPLLFSVANWNIPQTVSIIGQDDNFIDGDSSYRIMLDPTASDDPQYRMLPAVMVELVNRDNESQPIPSGSDAAILIESAKLLVTTENAGGVDTFTLTLNRRPSSDVYIPVTSSNVNEGEVYPAQIVFTVENWNQPQTVRVVGADDRTIDGDVSYQINIGPVESADFEFANVSEIKLPATNKDNDKIATAALNGLFIIGLLAMLIQRRRLRIAGLSSSGSMAYSSPALETSCRNNSPGDHLHVLT